MSALEFEIFFEEQRRNTGRRARESVFRVWVKKLGVKKPWRDETWTTRKPAVDRFNQLRRILNVSD